MSNTMSGKRIWELDFIRGAAVLGMIFTHINYVLIAYHNTYILSGIASDITEFLIKYGGTIFILISGICCCFSKNNLKRGLTLFFIAMVVTYVTVIYQYMFDPSHTSTIFFGILHFLSISMMAGHFLLKVPQKKYITNIFYLILGIVIIITGMILESKSISFPVICGNTINYWFLSADYFPLFPYIGWYILGIFIGKTFYCRGHVLFRSEKMSGFFIIRGISFIGKHSLIFYLAHQPVIFGIMFILQFAGLLN